MCEHKLLLVRWLEYPVCELTIMFVMVCRHKKFDKYFSVQSKRGCVIYQRKKTIANEIRPSVFASVQQSFFLVAASKTDVASKTKFNLRFSLYKPSVFTLLQYYPSVFSYRRFSGVWF